MEYQRLFISLAIDPVLLKKISRDLTSLSLPTTRLKFVKPENIHLTIKFLGDTPIDRLDPIIQALQSACQDFGPFELNLAETKIFPENDPQQAPRVLSLALKAEKQLQALYNKVEEVLWQSGLANKEMRKFTPHLTLARAYPGIKREDLKDFLAWKPQGAFYIDHLDLQASVLAKGGPQYTVLNTFDL